MNKVQLDIPRETVVWQVVRANCESRYGLVHADQENAMRPVYCSFCAHRATFYRARASGQA